jgi:hypothetical protein
VGDLDTADTAAGAARLAWLNALGEELAALVPPDPPNGFDPERWSALRRAVTGYTAALGDADEQAAVAAYRAGYGAYLSGLAGELALQADATAETFPGAREVAEQARNAAAAAEEGRLAAAWSHYEEAKRAFDGLVEEALGVSRSRRSIEGVPAASPAAAAAAPAETDLPEASQTTLPAPAGSALPSLADLNRRLARVDWTITILVGAAAVALGVFLLWQPDSSWGEAEDILAAILWGLGLHQVGNEAFAGLGGLTETIAPAAAPRA